MGISLVTYNEKTVTPQDDALVYETALRKSGFIYGCAVTLKSANVLRIAAGHGVIAGRKFTIEAQDINIQLTGSGTVKGRVYIHLDLSNVISPIQILTETAGTLTPPIQNDDVNIINGIYEFNVCEFTVGTSTISDLVNVAPTFGAMSKTLAAGETTVVFDNLPKYGNWLIDFYTSTGINYSEIDASVDGQVTLTFESQDAAVTVYCDIKGV